jgi:eukaryotic-like serine/threonine-protein kinase
VALRIVRNHGTQNAADLPAGRNRSRYTAPSALSRLSDNGRPVEDKGIGRRIRFTFSVILLNSCSPVVFPSFSSASRHQALLFRGQTLGKYKIIAPLGSGGFGTVYLAADTWIDKKVAIKVPHRQGLDFGELLREPRLLASVSHPNIVSITTAEKQDSVFFIVMEYVHGETLENIIALKGSLALNRALDFTCQICNAVDHAHRQGVIHRDLRPANVLVTENDMLKVADFGTSRFLEIAAHGTTVIGSPPYMAPEQFHGKAVFASDIYSLGVTMYQMLTGMLPYEPPAPSDLDKLMSGELVTPPRLRNSSIPRAINDIVMRAMAPELSRRYQRATDLLEDVLAVRAPSKPRLASRQPVAAELVSRPDRDDAQGIQTRVRARETPGPRFCWQCRKPLHARSDKCPFCGEQQ